MDDLISRQGIEWHNYLVSDGNGMYRNEQVAYKSQVDDLPSAQKEIIYCKDCRWWEKEAEDSRMGYCHACKHGHYSRHWEIRIIRTYEENFFCADAEPKEEGEENE